MSKPVVLELPLPDRDLHPNSRVHYMAKARKTKNHRAMAKVVAMFAKEHDVPWKAATVLCQFTFRDHRRRDKDSLLSCQKAYFDGIQDARVIEDDSQLTFLPVEILPPSSKTGVKITITETPT